MSLTPTPSRPAPRRRSLWWRLGAPVLVVLFLLVIGAWVYRSWGPRTCKMHMLVDFDPNRALVAERLAREARRHGLEIELSNHLYGALEAIELVDSPNPIDLALVSGGVARREYANVRQVAALSLEPLQLLVRPELADEGLGRLKGRRIAIGPPTTSTHYIARDLLTFAGLHPATAGRSGDYTVDETSPQELRGQLERMRGQKAAERDQAVRQLPDAVFLLAPLPSLLASDLVRVAGYRLVALPFAEAYCLDRIRTSEAGDVRVDRATFAAVDVPAFTYSVDPPVPVRPCRTIAARLLLIGYAPTDPEAIARLAETVFDGSIAGLIEPMPLKGHAPQFPLHAGTERYLRRSEPLLSPELVAGLGKAAAGLGALISGLVAVYSFLRLRQLRRFEAYYQEIRHLELIARGHEADPAAPADPCARRAYLEDRLLDLKSRALADFANGGLRGEGLMFGIVSLVNDTRASLARLAPAAAQTSAPGPPPS
jgi:X-X-X-Leu-X-X-Gly heptad repeat protein